MPTATLLLLATILLSFVISFLWLARLVYLLFNEKPAPIMEKK